MPGRASGQWAHGEDSEVVPAADATPPESTRWSAVTALVVASVLSVGVLAAVVLLLKQIDEKQPTAALALVLVSAAVVLILVVASLTVILKRLRLDNGKEAMGLPAGSVRAVIALLLIMLFFISAMFLFDATQHRTVDDPADLRTVQGLTATQYSGLPLDQVQSSTERLVDGEVRYDVVLYPPPVATPTSDDLAKQLVTTVATLVTAVAAFYFGSNTVLAARNPRARTAPAPPTAPVPSTPAPATAPARRGLLRRRSR